MNMKSRYKPTRIALICWCLFIGIGAVAGACAMLVAPDGSVLQMQSLLPYFKVLPFADLLFTNYIFPGISLLIVNGLTNLTAAVLLILNKKSGILLGGLFGVTLMAWICIQFVIFPANFLSTSYFIFGLIQALTGYAAWIFYAQEHFEDKGEEYNNIGNDGSQLVVYFSRMGYTKRLAYQTADRLGADIYEIKCSENTSGTLGFWWCGRYAMHRWGMPLLPVELDLGKYQRVIICSPIWAFHLAAPMREFCKLESGKIKAADYLLVHHNHSSYQNAADEMDSLLGITHGSLRSVRCHAGKYKKIAQ